MKQHEKSHWHQFMNPDYEQQRQRGRIWGGLILLAAGGAFLAKSLGVLLPFWLFKWPMILVLVGVYQLGKNNFKRPQGLIPLLIGAMFLIDIAIPGLQYRHIMYPVLIMAVGAFLLLTPKRNKFKYNAETKSKFTDMADREDGGDTIMADSIFGGVERNIISKDFKGGKVNCVFGGAEINLMQADIQGTVTLEMNAVFGGIELTVPASWKVITEVSAVMGGVQDKRTMSNDMANTEKILVLKGAAVFGGIEIKSF
jgi:predicted membrane protein